MKMKCDDFFMSLRIINLCEHVYMMQMA